MSYIHRYLILFFLCAKSFVYGGAPPAHKDILKIVETYLNGLKGFKAGFAQYNPDHSVFEGEIRLRRGQSSDEGLVLIKYTTGTSQKILAKNGYVTVYEKDGSENAVDLSYTPLSFILKSMISLNEYHLKEIEESADKKHFLITICQTEDLNGPSLTLIFSKLPGGGIQHLVMWEVVDIQGQKTVVQIDTQTLRVNDMSLLRIEDFRID